jgi:tRNA-binding EMAP/Myf-like protein
MKTPLNWISLYTPLSSILSTHSTTELAHEYSIHTAEIDGIESHFLDRVVVGKVISCSRHPDSKKLSIVEVQISKTSSSFPNKTPLSSTETVGLLPLTGEPDGTDTTIILTGAPNISEATYVPVALV